MFIYLQYFNKNDLLPIIDVHRVLSCEINSTLNKCISQEDYFIREAAQGKEVKKWR